MSDKANESAKKNPYRASLNLPTTRFPMKANLVQREPAFQRRWEEIELYRRIREAPHPAGPFVLHDGPPYANGDIHLGHLLNKVLKDLVVRSRTMMGCDVDFVPGWDCHGLPIEYRVLQELGEQANGMSPLQIRRKCERYAQKQVKRQSRQLQRLGTLGDYDDPYLTMAPGYEAEVLEVFASLVAAGLIYRALKPVHWSTANRTALAEAELDYCDRDDPSVYVLFDAEENTRLPAALGAPAGSADLQLMIWTTTPWTLPANLAIAVAPDARYALYRFAKDGDASGRTKCVLIAERLAAKTLALEQGGASQIQKLGVASGRELVAADLCYRHPFAEDGRRRPLVAADYVTLEDGTGLVHTAPGHGVDDHATGMREGLEVICPVAEDGTFDTTAPAWLRGVSIWDANEIIIDRLRATGHLFRAERFSHSYPHDWRSKTPVIVRATEQWFVGVDRAAPVLGGQTLRELARKSAAEKIDFLPAWGRKRLRGMLETRPDWCLSRQRSWGLPIPAFYGPLPGQVLLTAASVRAVAEVFRARGSNPWFAARPSELLAAYDWRNDPDAPAWLLAVAGAGAGAGAGADKLDEVDLTPSSDIFDVWFESGSSWRAVLQRRGLGFPADLYLEGSDQHRGWFQLSLLAGLGASGQVPFKSLLTHGFVVDARGLKMSKSGDDALAVADLLRDHGADVCRWWVCGLNYANDVKADAEFFRIAGEQYRKVRNTLRFLLSNLADFEEPRDRRELTPADDCSLDAWAMGQLDLLVGTVRDAYARYEFRAAQRALFDFCNHSMSSVYLAAVKDRLYCDAPESDRRRRCQTSLWEIANGLCLLLAPILVHTADEALLALRGLDLGAPACVHAERLPEIRRHQRDIQRASQLDRRWTLVMQRREVALKALEEARRDARSLDNPLDAGIRFQVPAAEHVELAEFEPELADLCGVSQFQLVPGSEMHCEVIDLREEARCERCWKRDGTVSLRSDGGWLSERDWKVVTSRRTSA